MLRNLLRNALEALADTREPALRIRVFSLGESVELRISDTGKGVPMRELERAFDPFFSTKPDHSGLGLTAARRLATRMGARLELQREPEGGVSVRLSLPVARQGQVGARGLPAGRPKLLLLHRPDRARRLQAALAEDFRVVVMAPEEAIRHLLGGASYEMVLCSLLLPEMTGLSFASALAMTRPSMAERLVLLVPPQFGHESGKLLEQLHIWHLDDGLPAAALSESLSGLLRLWWSLGFR